ncbi:Pseudouridine-metabolizing bifunctional protein [Tolypocladium capitatum]|uniref:Pseudouridine-metabolizing bifunctional protein n=1 Tax=Tolypocladium capitatum TaxID=45235 RepID=A0A2K3QCF2_9HYPO|nr:Pseudouridine-metabolizing bifunctional protein [Tolypocladium capitatum]
MTAARLAIPVGRRGIDASSVRCSHPVSQLVARPHSTGPGRAPCLRRGFAAASAASASPAFRGLVRVSDEVADAVRTNKPVVALESTIYTHGAMGKHLAREHEDLVRSHGGIPAIIAVVDGVPTVGVSPQQIVRMIEDEGTVKASRRDIAYLAGMPVIVSARIKARALTCVQGLAGRKMHGGTTIAGTMLLARLAGIRVFGTGGLGGVHRGGESSMDVSADLTELGRTRVAVIASGCKGFLDIPRTLEYLETQGCLVSTFADGRSGKVDFPAFWARNSGTKSPSVVYTDKEAAAMILAQEQLGIESGIFFANPIPEESGVPSEEMGAAIEQAVREAVEKGFAGSENTPYVLQRLKQLTGEKAVTANKALVTANIIRATKISVELSRLLSPDAKPVMGSTNGYNAPETTEMPAMVVDPKADILVAGAVAVDLSCDYTSTKPGETAPQPHTSNPARISQSIGGVGHNVALAAHLASRQARVQFCSMVGDDVAGSTVLSSLQTAGLDTTFVRKLEQQSHPGSRTAQYVAVNDGSRNLVMAMADMGIFTQHSDPDHMASAVAATSPKWLVVDGNWSPKDIRAWIRTGKDHSSKVAFEPVSVEKSRGLFCRQRGVHRLDVFPQASIDLASPNTHELAAMYAAARDNGYLELGDWFDIIDSFGMRGARDRFLRLTSADLTDAGVPVQSVQLLPYVPTLVTKLGPKGVLLTTLLGRDDPLLRDRDAEEFILARAVVDHPSVGGIYMRMFPAAETVQNIVSVNGVGDTFLGVLISGLAQGGRVENLINVAQRGAVLSLKCRESVNPNLGQLEHDLGGAVSRK